MKVCGWLVALISFCCFGICCDNASSPDTPNSDTDEFRFLIRISDVAGNPMPGMRVNAWNGVPEWVAEIIGYEVFSDERPYVGLQPPDELIVYQNCPNPFSSATTLRFDLPVEGLMRIMIYDLERTLVSVLVDDTLDAGAHVLIWDGRPNLTASYSSAVYQAVLEYQRDNPDSTADRDTLYMARYRPEASSWSGVVGISDESGSVESLDRLFAVHTYTYPALEATDETGVSMGTFRFHDLVTLTVTDTISGHSRTYEVALGSGDNIINLTW